METAKGEEGMRNPQLDEWDRAYALGAEAMRASCIAAVEKYFDRGEYSPAQLFDHLRETQP